MSRLIAIGDIHGQIHKLETLLADLPLQDEDRLVFLGDYVDRGPDVCAVINLLLELAEERPRTVFLRGNHEQMLLDALIETHFVRGAGRDPVASAVRGKSLHSAIQHHLQNGGLATLKSYSVNSVAELPHAHITFLQQTRLYFRAEGFLFVHAGASNDLPVEEQDIRILLWDRHLEPGTEEIHVVGHKPTTNGRPCFEPGRYSIDTGAGFGNPLTACDVITREFWQA